MFLPFYRGDGAWIQRLQAVEYIRKIELLLEQHSGYAPVENGLNLPISPEVYASIASADYLRERFSSRYQAQNNSLAAGFKGLQDLCRQFSVSSLHDLGPEFDFSIALYVDQYCIHRKNIEQILYPIELDAIPATAIQCIKPGFLRYQEDDFKEALHYFKQALMIAPSLYPLMYRIGLIHLNCPDWVDEGNAFYYFKTCGDVAANRGDTDMTARAFLHASFAAYLLTKDHESMQLAQKTITLDPSLAESYYLYAKVATMHDTASALIKIRSAIAIHLNYVLKVGADHDMEPILERLFIELKKEAETRAEIRFSEFDEERKRTKTIERSIREQEEILGQVGAHRPFFEHINHHFEKLEEIYKRNTFFDYNLFITKYDECCREWLSPAIKERLRAKLLRLKQLAKNYQTLEKEIISHTQIRQFLKFTSCITLNTVFIGLVVNLIDLAGWSADWLSMIPGFCLVTLLVAYADILFDKTNRILYVITLHLWRLNRNGAFGAGLKVHMHEYYSTIYFALNTFFLLTASASFILSQPDARPHFIFFPIGVTFFLVWAYRKFRALVKTNSYAKLKLDDEINQVILAPLT